MTRGKFLRRFAGNFNEKQGRMVCEVYKSKQSTWSLAHLDKNWRSFGNNDAICYSTFSFALLIRSRLRNDICTATLQIRRASGKAILLWWYKQHFGIWLFKFYFIILYLFLKVSTFMFCIYVWRHTQISLLIGTINRIYIKNSSFVNFS